MGCEGNGRSRRYEIRLAGRLGPALQLAFPGLHAAVEPRHGVLLVPAGGEDLLDVLAQLRRRQVEMVRARSRLRSPLPRDHAGRDYPLGVRLAANPECIVSAENTAGSRWPP